jgi:hypothetical protein
MCDGFRYPFVTTATPAGKFGLLAVTHSATHASFMSLTELLDAMCDIHMQGWFVLSPSRLNGGDR